MSHSICIAYVDVRLRPRAALCALLMATLAATIGCGDRSGRAGVSGMVTFAGGDRIDHGTIEFSPLDGTSSGIGGAPIIDGLYQISRQHGLQRGKYRVRIYAPTLVEAKPGAPGALGLAAPEERVAARFNVETELVAIVPDDNDQKIDFQVE